MEDELLILLEPATLFLPLFVGLEAWNTGVREIMNGPKIQGE